MGAINDNFVHLHVHSTFSFVDGFGLPEQFVKRAKELGQTALGVTDHGNISAHSKWYRECKKYGIKPILGCEFYIHPNKNEHNERKYHHLTVLALTNEGYQNLLQLVTKSWSGETRKPLITMEEIIEKQKGLLITSGCPSSEVCHLIRNGLLTTARERLEYFRDHIDNFYIEITPWEFDMGKGLILPLYGFSKSLGIPIVATMDCHYVNEDEHTLQEILLCIQSNNKMSNPNRWKFDQNGFYLRTRAEMENAFKNIYPDLDFSDALDNTVKIAEKVEMDFPKSGQLKFPIPQREKTLLFEEKCNSSMKTKKLSGIKEYEDRLKYELDLIEKKDYIDYFLVVEELVMYAKNNGILVGPARGSSAGSLVCYLLRITEVDPIKHKLIFERFIDIYRDDPPDIDIDFEDERRNDVINHLKEKYGEDHASQIATFATFKGKNILQDFGRIYELPFELINKLKSVIIERSGADSRASLTLEDTFKQFDIAKKGIEKYPQLLLAPRLEGQLRNLSAHASGIVISNEPLTKVCSFYKTNGQTVTSFDYKDASNAGLIKFDILGLNTLTSIARTLKLIKERTGKEIDIYNLPLDDEMVYKGFRDHKKLFGIFQFDGQATNQVCRQMMPKNFEELSAINALSRPGPMHGNDIEFNMPITSVYLARKDKKIPYSVPHKLMSDIVKDTYGVVIYQEQIIRVMREIGNMTWEDTGEIRRAISRKKGIEIFNKLKEKFAIGAKGNGLNDEEINKIWEAICRFGSWAFNRCLTGDTVLINTNPDQFSPKEITLKELYDNNGYVTPRWKEQPHAYKKMNTLSLDLDGRIRPKRIKDIFCKGKQTVFKITTKDGHSIKATINHRFLVSHGYKTVSQLKPGDSIALNSGYELNEYVRTELGKGWRKGRSGGAGDMKDGITYEVNRFKESNRDKCCEHCGNKYRRMEVHHVTRTPPSSVLEWLCVSCHKHAEYQVGRIKVWEKGFKRTYDLIRTIEKCPEENVYDVEMENPTTPTFVANGFISHNSHSVSYSIISYNTMWLKVHYPLEYYAGMMSALFNHAKVRRIVKEYQRDGFKLLPLDINKSKKSFIIDGKNIRLGFDQLRGMGSETIRKIIDNQPYSNILELEEKAKLGKRGIETIGKIGALDSIGGANIKMNTLFGEETGTKYDVQTSVEERMKLCPLSVDLNLFEKWETFVRENIKFPLFHIEELNPEINSQVVMGVVYDKNLKDKIEEAITKNRPAPVLRDGKSQYFNFMLEDDTDFVTVRVSTHNCEKFKSLIFEEISPGDIVMVKGKFGDGIRMFFCNEMICLNHLKEKLDGKREKNFTESELILLGKLWKPIQKRNWY